MDWKLFPYVGSKSWLVPLLLRLFERLSADVLVSPFLGRGVFEYAYARKFSKTPVLCFDVNAALLGVHRAYASDSKRLENAIRSLDPRLSREDYYALKARYAALAEVSGDFQGAAEFVRFMTNSFSGKYGSYVNSKRSLPVSALATPCPSNLSVARRDVFELLRNPPPGRLAWYLDPPYFVPTTHYQGSTNLGFQHGELAKLLLEMGGLWVLSYNDCPEVRSLYASCAILEVGRGNNSLSNVGGESTELLILSPAAFALCGSALVSDQIRVCVDPPERPVSV